MLDFLYDVVTGMIIFAFFGFPLICLYETGHQEIVRVIWTVTSILAFLSLLIATVFYLMGRRR